MDTTKPNRATHTYRQRLCASPAKVFPLLCPVREAEWVDGWLPELVISSSGVAERDCVFITADKLEKTIWYITRHEPQRWFVEMLKILPGATACRLEIQLSDNGDGCFADVTYAIPAWVLLATSSWPNSRPMLTKIHAGLGEGIKPFFDYRTVAYR